MKFSVILPIYNIGNFLEDAINSIINQSYDEIEIILVNDGSTDNSYEICLRYVETNKHIVLINQENSGVGIARNNGLKKATGDYIYFMDPDDYLDLDLFSDVNQVTDKNHFDMVLFGYRKVNEKGGELKLEKKPSISGDLTIEGIPELLLNEIGLFVWDKIIRRDFLISNDIFFDNKKRGQDIAFTIKCLSVAKTFYSISKSYYNYRILFDAAPKNDSNIITNQVDNFLLLQKLINKIDISKQSKDEVLTHFYYKWFLVVVPMHIYNNKKITFYEKLNKLNNFIIQVSPLKPDFTNPNGSILIKIIWHLFGVKSSFLLYLFGLIFTNLRNRFKIINRK
jgi:glycosyltransferase involved in cell wall biosynthesis